MEVLPSAPLLLGSLISKGGSEQPGGCFISHPHGSCTVQTAAQTKALYSLHPSKIKLSHVSLE